jgi:hypothetical protein
MYVEFLVMKEVLNTTSNQLLSPFTVAVRLRDSTRLYMHLMGPKMRIIRSYFAINLIGFSCRLPNFEQNQSRYFVSQAPS